MATYHAGEFLAPPPTDQELADWFIFPHALPHKIGRWPTAGSLRTDCRYRMSFTTDLFPTASRWLVHTHHENPTDPVAFPEFDTWSWFDIAPTAPNDLDGTPDELGTANPTLGMRWYQVDEHAQFVEPFTRCDVTVTKDGNPMVFQLAWRTLTDPFRGWTHSGTGGPSFLSKDLRFWGWGINEIELWSISECFRFDRVQQGPLSFASFNGTDAEIVLDQTTPFSTDNFLLSADVRLRSRDDAYLLSNSADVLARYGFNGSQFHLRQVTMNPSPLPPLDEWFNVRVSLEWDDPALLTYVLKFDDVEVDKIVSVRIFPLVNLLGSYTGFSGKVWGDFDMSNLMLKRDGPATPRTELHLPLEDDACDVGPLGIKGTTFNMSLPSCP